ncbi:N utilization substance protein B [Fervidobacterium thailandense]|uniref:Transcription antitermination protein NusB n=2 Tax=Fervidobacterium thailandense TaxID=1008305 RepID=A0A1E3G5P6_9BACT|nr:N utilization substance protein B [Fervidobacterium thailandense]
MRVLFQYDFNPEGYRDFVEEELKKITDTSLRNDFQRYVQTIFENLSRIDETISKYLINWSFERISHLERSLLRLGTYELIFEPNIPIEVTLDEMIEIAKKYGTEESGKFINGVLDKIAKTEAPSEKFNL